MKLNKFYKDIAKEDQKIFEKTIAIDEKAKPVIKNLEHYLSDMQRSAK